MKSKQLNTALKAVLANNGQNLNEVTLKQLVEEDDYLDEEDMYVLEVVAEAMEVYTEELNDEVKSKLGKLKKEFKSHSHADGEVKTPSKV